jgi:hypothetical protein
MRSRRRGAGAEGQAESGFVREFERAEAAAHGH